MTKKIASVPETAYLKQDVHEMLGEMHEYYGKISKSLIINQALRLKYQMMQLEIKQNEERLALFQGNLSPNDRRQNRRR